MRSLVLIAVIAFPAMVCADDIGQWQDLAAIPNVLGLGGPIVGTSHNALIVAGGANFPDGPPWPRGDSPAGTKVWHDRIYALDAVDGQWADAGRLPYPLAYAAAVSTSEGVYVLGGETFQGSNRPTAEVRLLTWDADTRQVMVIENALPPLPRPSQYHQAAMIDGVLYVAASHANQNPPRRLDSQSLWSLDLHQPAAQRCWIELEPWPGPPREKMSLAVQYVADEQDVSADKQDVSADKQDAAADEENVAAPCLFLFSGENWYRDAAGQPDFQKYQTFTDAYRYRPQTNQWTRIADLPVVPEVGPLPRPAVAAAAIAVDRSRVLVFSGADGRFFHLPVEQRPPFSAVVLEYHTGRDAWSIAGQMPLAVVTTSAVRWNRRIVIPSGEAQPGVRTDRVQSLLLRPL